MQRDVFATAVCFVLVLQIMNCPTLIVHGTYSVHILSTLKVPNSLLQPLFDVHLERCNYSTFSWFLCKLILMVNDDHEIIHLRLLRDLECDRLCRLLLPLLLLDELLDKRPYFCNNISWGLSVFCKNPLYLADHIRCKINHANNSLLEAQSRSKTLQFSLLFPWSGPWSQLQCLITYITRHTYMLWNSKTHQHVKFNFLLVSAN